MEVIKYLIWVWRRRAARTCRGWEPRWPGWWLPCGYAGWVWWGHMHSRYCIGQPCAWGSHRADLEGNKKHVISLDLNTWKSILYKCRRQKILAWSFHIIVIFYIYCIIYIYYILFSLISTKPHTYSKASNSELFAMIYMQLNYFSMATEWPVFLKWTGTSGKGSSLTSFKFSN